MKSEMDALRLDERQRLCWLRANRITLMTVGLVWLGMIAWEIAHGNWPRFLIAMVPAFALVRVVAYLLYARRS